MATTDDATPKSVTAQEVAGLIDMTEAGEYDSYHEWSPSFDLKGKADVLEGLMANWEVTEPEGRRRILEFARKLNKEWIDSAEPITNIVARYAHLPEVVNLVLNEFLMSGRFCLQLLLSMKDNRIKQDDWLSKIGTLAAEGKFIESKKILKRCDVYEGIAELLSEM